METESTGREPPRAPTRAMQAIEALAQARAPVSLATLSTQLELPKTSLMHLLRALEAAGYVRRFGNGYKLGSASFRLAAAIGSANSFEDLAADVLQALRDSTQETALLGTFTEDRQCALYTDRRPSPQAVRFAPEVGEQRPLYSTGVGKLLLAYSEPAFLNQYLRGVKLQAHAARTLRTKAALRENLERIRAEGVSVSIDEMADGGSALAAPVFGADGKLRAALVLAVPTARFLVHRAHLEAQLRAGARDLSGTVVASQA
ncbi:IclR family transcriptional regulator [Ramlibacter sp. G-1-2-2]|uniref:IclR family transcriptional regulator n=1 Tax=Ramlibacter agri TaxID=2728837 RepID=A0A848H9P2_9BURK|nr:IclR family transcriptional regulator [Ramlibacter agri]NML44348.1 IclR family transcriptional regulator [Ramlibacter agri]